IDSAEQTLVAAGKYTRDLCLAGGEPPVVGTEPMPPADLLCLLDRLYGHGVPDVHVCMEIGSASRGGRGAPAGVPRGVRSALPDRRTGGIHALRYRGHRDPKYPPARAPSGGYNPRPRISRSG